MFGLGIPEMVVILIIALIIFGPKRLPEMGKSLGKAVREFKEGADQLKDEVSNSTGLDEKSRKELKESLTFKDVQKDLEGVGKDLSEVVTLEEPKKESENKEENKEEVKS